jgi:hypothetical protein
MSKNLTKIGNTPKNSSVESIRTQQTLSHGNCESTFYNMLRTGDHKNGHIETKLSFVPIKVNRRCREQKSHIFTGEDPSTIKESQKKHLKHLISNVIFNDSYVETNPQINPRKKARYNFEEKYKKNQKYSDELILSDRRRKLLQRKIKDNYTNNPMKILNKEEREQYNKAIILKNKGHSKAFNKIFNSNSCKRLLGGIKKNKSIIKVNQINKITNNDFNITKKAEVLNKNEDNQIPYYGRRHYRFASYGSGNGLVYLD